jgi:hypothetical protein
MSSSADSVLSLPAFGAAMAPSDRPTPPRAVEVAFGRRSGPAAPACRRGRARIGSGKTRHRTELFRKEGEHREPGIKPPSLAWTLREPLEG